MITERLYFSNSYLQSFNATVVAHGRIGDYPAVALDRSAFYPEGGGQPADQGTLNGLAVIDVQSDDDDVVWHVLARAEDLGQLTVGANVQGTIDWARRFDHMQQHCGQHILTAAFVASCGLQTISFHLGEDTTTIDLDCGELSAAQVSAAEDLANQVIWEDRPVAARFVTTEELARLPLRKAASVETNIRVVTIEDFDYSACGGTHPRSTGSVGMLSVVRWYRQRGGIRVEFAAGGRALQSMRRLSAAASAAAATLSVGIDELPAATERLLASQKAGAKELEQARTALDTATAQGLYTGAEAVGSARVACSALPGLSLERLRSVAQAIASQPGGVAILGLPGERAQLVVACAAESGRDARAILEAGLPPLAGRGGGNARMAQGGGSNSAALDAALTAMLAAARG